MSGQIDYAEISRHARRIVDANRAQAVLEQVLSAAADPSPDEDNQPDGEGSTSQPKKIRYTRSTKGCMGCRKHKVKCDETLPTCLRCVASQRVCDYSGGAGQTQGRKRRSTTTRKKSEPEMPRAEPTDGSIPENDVQNNSRPSNYEDSALATHITGAGALSMISGGPSTGWDGWDTSPLDQSRGSWVPESLSGISTTSPDMSFLNDIFSFTPAPTLPALETSPSQILPLNFLATTPAPTGLAETLPQFSNLGKSRLMTRRTAKSTLPPESIPTSLVPNLAHPRLALIETILIASEFDESLFEFGPSGRVQQTSRGGTDILSKGFPSVPARTLFHHYYNVSSKYLVTMGNIGPNPLIALCTINKLLDTASAASAAIRMSILSISIAHFTYETVDVVGAANLGSRWPETRARLEAVGRKFKKAALSNIFLAEAIETSSDHVDSILAACTFICIRDVISADPTWADNMEFVLKLAHKRGGPQAMLKDCPGGINFTRRYLLENLATHDVFSCFTTGKEPALLGNYDCWWFESVETSQTRWEWESVERTFGISRAMVDLVARVVTLNCRKRRLGIVMSDHPNENEMQAVGQHFVRESHCLLLEADIWGNSLSALPQHYRVTCGDYIYKYMTVVIILADILEQPISTPRIAKSVDSILELCSEATAMRMSVMLTWPLLIAGLYCVQETREKVSSLFEAFQYDYCEDLRTARALLQEQWRSVDAGEGRKSWREVMKKLGKHAMLI